MNEADRNIVVQRVIAKMESQGLTCDPEHVDRTVLSLLAFEEAEAAQ